MGRVLDADTHIAEPPEMWDFLDPDWHKRRPVVVQVPEDTLYGRVDHMWLIDGQIYPRPAGRGGNFLVTPTAQKNVRDRRRQEGARTARPPDAVRGHAGHQRGHPGRLPHALPRLPHPRRRLRGRALQGVQPLPRRCMGEGGRPHPLRRHPPAPQHRRLAVSELRFGKEHGACGVFFRGIEGDKTLDDPYFFPVYEEAQSLLASPSASTRDRARPRSTT